MVALTIAADHPAYTGHFPGMPVLPGVVLLDAVLREIGKVSRRPRQEQGWQVAAAKFQSAVRPGEALTLEHDLQANGSIRFSIRAGDRLVAQGLLIPPESRVAPDSPAPSGSR